MKWLLLGLLFVCSHAQRGLQGGARIPPPDGGLEEPPVREDPLWQHGQLDERNTPEPKPPLNENEGGGARIDDNKVPDRPDPLQEGGGGARLTDDDIVSPEAADVTPFPSMSPSYSTAFPTIEPMTNTTVRGVRQRLRNARRMNPREIRQWEWRMERWFRRYYRGKRIRHRRRRRRQGSQRWLQDRRREGRDLDTEITFVSQNVTVDGDGVPTNEIEYDQSILFEEDLTEEDDIGTDDEELDDFSGNATSNVISYDSVEELASLPFQDESANEELAVDLQENLESFQEIKIPLEVPNVPVADSSTWEPTSSTSYRNLAPMMAVAALVIVFSVAALCLYRRYRNKRKD